MPSAAWGRPAIRHHPLPDLATIQARYSGTPSPCRKLAVGEIEGESGFSAEDIASFDAHAMQKSASNGISTPQIGQTIEDSTLPDQHATDTQDDTLGVTSWEGYYRPANSGDVQDGSCKVAKIGRLFGHMFSWRLRYGVASHFATPFICSVSKPRK